VLATAEERHGAPGFVTDPVGDAAAERTPGLLQKYRGRALLIATGACAVHCRYCFRHHYPYSEAGSLWDRIERALAILRDSTEIAELILSGGDPLMLDDAMLARLFARLADDVPHLRRVRLHTRLPVVLPSRVTDDLCRLLRGDGPRAVVVIHANHPRELSPSVLAALAALRDAHIPLLNQSVLLRGVNDSSDVLAELSERLFDAGVASYYLHQLDRVAGAAHFEVPDAEALGLIADLRARLPGYLVPRLVREVPGAAHKVPLG
jgi:EF-P beta-lysylation protein EpmB